jgi:hypothetical protein
MDGANLVLVQRQEGKDSIVAKATNLRESDNLWLTVKSRGGRSLQFLYKSGVGRKPGILNKAPVNASFLPPWDRAVRVGIVVRGHSGKGVVEQFSIRYSRP